MDDPLLPPPPGAEFDLPPPETESEPAPVRPSVASNPFLARAQKFGVKGSGGGGGTPRGGDSGDDDQSASMAKMSVTEKPKTPAKASNPYKAGKGGGGGGGVTNAYKRAVISDEPEPTPTVQLQNPYAERQSVARKPTEVKSSGGYGGGGGDYGGGGGDDDLPPPPGGDDDGAIPEPRQSVSPKQQPKQSVASPYQQPKQSVASPSPYTKSPSQAYSPPPPADDEDAPPVDDPEEAERKQRIIDKIKKQQQAFQAGIISGGEPKLVAASMAPTPQPASGGGRGGGGRPGGGDDVPYIADDGKGPWCAFCGATLKGQQVMEVGGKEYHPRCFVCAQCRKPLTGQMVTVQERYYHPGCLQCKHCGQNLNGKQFVVNPSNKQVYCPEHGRLDKSGTKGLTCAGCKDPISGKEPVINALNAQWHQMCFVCDNCREPLVGQACVANKGKPYCEGCYEQLFRTKCAACNEIIDGQVLELGSEGSAVSYHPGCFKCGTCSKPLKGSPFYLKGPGVYCEAHAL
jgi:hypothetical protein